MKTMSKTALVATFLIVSAAGASAFEGPSTLADWNYARNPNAPVPQYATQAYAQVGSPQGRVIENRSPAYAQGVHASVDTNYFDRNALIDSVNGTR